LYHAALRIRLISNEQLQYAVESLIRIYLVKEHTDKYLYLLNKMSCKMGIDVKKGR
jgi:hypothetical protein